MKALIQGYRGKVKHKIHDALEKEFNISLGLIYGVLERLRIPFHRVFSDYFITTNGRENYWVIQA